MTEAPPAEPSSERLGRRVALVVFGLVVGVITVNFSTQIIVQAFGLGESEAPTSCEVGLRELLEGVEAARRSAAPVQDEAQAVQAFRVALGPRWQSWAGVKAACEQAPEQLRRFELLMRLRFAEEQTVRYEARGVATDRREVADLRKQFASPAP